MLIGRLIKCFNLVAEVRDMARGVFNQWMVHYASYFFLLDTLCVTRALTWLHVVHVPSALEHSGIS
jgi:hypothetical protein